MLLYQNMTLIVYSLYCYFFSIICSLIWNQFFFYYYFLNQVFMKMRRLYQSNVISLDFFVYSFQEGRYTIKIIQYFSNFSEIYVITVCLILLVLQEDYSHKIQLTSNVSSNCSRHFMLAHLFLFWCISDIQCELILQPTFNVGSFYLDLYPALNVSLY